MIEYELFKQFKAKKADMNQLVTTAIMADEPILPFIPEEIPQVTAVTTRNPFLRWLPAISQAQKIGLALMVVSTGALIGAFYPLLAAETTYRLRAIRENVSLYAQTLISPVAEAEAEPPDRQTFNPLLSPDGTEIVPVNTDFAIVIPRLGINSPVIAGVNPAKPVQYQAALKKGVAHASTSFYPDENGTVYLFSHSTNYEWFVKDLNAIFYLVKNLEENDLIVILYLGKRYTYQVREQRIVTAKDVNYILPHKGERKLILQTCWPPGTVSKRLLVLADLVDEQGL